MLLASVARQNYYKLVNFVATLLSQFLRLVTQLTIISGDFSERRRTIPKAAKIRRSICAALLTLKNRATKTHSRQEKLSSRLVALT